MTQRDTYTPEQVAEVARVNRRTVYRWIASERLPAHKIGPKLWVIYRQVLTAFMAGKDAERLHSMAASLQGRKTIVTPAPVPGPLAEPNDACNVDDIQEQPALDGHTTAYELAQTKLAEMEQEARATDSDRGSGSLWSYGVNAPSSVDRAVNKLLTHLSYNDTEFVQMSMPGTDRQPPKKKKRRR